MQRRPWARPSSARSLTQEIETLRTRLNRTLDELLDTPRSSESYPALQQRRAQVEDAIGRLRAERARLADQPAPGLTADESAALADFAVEVRGGVAGAGPEDRRGIYQLLQLR